MKQLGWYDTGNRGAIGEKTYEYREPWRFRQWEMEEERQEREGRREERETPVHLNEEETRWLEIRSRDFTGRLFTKKVCKFRLGRASVGRLTNPVRV